MHGTLFQLSTTLVLFAGLIIAGGAAFVGTGCLRQLAHRWQLLDRPNGRSFHALPTPRLGGIAIVAAVFVGVLFFALATLGIPGLRVNFFAPGIGWILGGALIMAGAGLYDDLKGLKPRGKLLLQVLAAAMVMGTDFRLNVLPRELFGGSGWEVPVGCLLTLVWIVGVTNAINLIDGLDGLAAGTAVIALAAISISMTLVGGHPQVGLVAAVVAAAIGFLVHNAHPARIFMGDTGSLFLGFLLAVACLVPAGGPVRSWDAFAPILALGFPLLDTFVAVVRRLRNGRGIFAPDRDHIHHRMATHLGLSHRASVFALYGLSLAFGGLAVFLPRAEGMMVLVVSVGGGLLAVVGLLAKLGYISVSVGEIVRLRPRS